MLTNLLVENDKTTVDTKDTAVIRRLYDQMVCKSPGYFFTMAYKLGHWDGNVKFFDKANRCFDTGLLSWAASLLDWPNVVDLRTPPAREFTVEAKVTLRDYQLEVLEMCQRCTRGIIRAATGSGKTEIMIALISALGVPTIILVDSKDLLNQTVNRILEGLPGICVRAIHSGKEFIDGEGVPLVTVSTFQTLNRKKHLIDKYKFGLKISDECHGVAADTWYEVMGYIDSYYSYGFSGSVQEEFDDQVRWHRITGRTGKPIITIPSSTLVDLGWLAKPLITMVTYDTNSSSGTFSDEYDVAITNCEALNKQLIPALLTKHAGQKTMIIVDRIEHGRALEQTLCLPFVHGGDTIARRKEVLKQFRSGEIRSLVASRIFRQGIDVPDLEVLISADSNLSYKAVFQKLGRGMRRAEGKSQLFFYDIWPKTGEFLDKHAGERLKKYKWLGFEPTVLSLPEILPPRRGSQW